LADDIEEMRALLRMLLTRDGRFVVVGEAGDGAAAIDVVEREQPDLVVLDVKMPALTGIEALPRLLNVAPLARIVVLSAFTATEMAQSARELGAVGYIEKHANVSTLPAELYALSGVLETVQHVLDTTYAAAPESAREARTDLRSALASRVDANTLEVVELLTTELVINSVEHAGTKASVAAELHRNKVRVAVSDDGPGIPRRSDPSADVESGRGLVIVESLASDWGVDRSEGGKTVWFEVAVDQ
jgi:DNA-binding NarL/FixJ family response regulator